MTNTSAVLLIIIGTSVPFLVRGGGGGATAGNLDYFPSNGPSDQDYANHFPPYGGYGWHNQQTSDQGHSSHFGPPQYKPPYQPLPPHPYHANALADGELWSTPQSLEFPGGDQPWQGEYSDHPQHRYGRDQAAPVVDHWRRDNWEPAHRMEEAFHPWHTVPDQRAHGGKKSKQSMSSLAAQVNGLCKTPSGLKKLATIVAQMPWSQHFHHSSPKNLALLINGIAKLLEQGESRRAAMRVMTKLAQEVCRWDLSNQQWQPQTLALVVGGLGKATGDHISLALKALAREVTQRDLTLWTVQGLVLGVSGFSKGEGGDGVTRALTLLAREINGRSLSQWSEQHMAMAISGLGKTEAEEVDRAEVDRTELAKALDALAQEITQKDLSQWSQKHLAMTICGIGKVPSKEKMTLALSVLARVVATQDLSRWTEQHLAMAINGFSKTKGDEITVAMEALARAIGSQGLGKWQKKYLAMAVNGISKVKGEPMTQALNTLAREIAGRNLGYWPEQSLAMVSAGLGETEGLEITKALNVIAQTLVEKKRVWTGQQLAMLITGLNKIQGAEVTNALNELAQVIVDLDLSRWTDQQLVAVADGIGKATGAAIAKALKAMAEEIVGRKLRLDRWCVQHLARVANRGSKAEGEDVAKVLGNLTGGLADDIKMSLEPKSKEADKPGVDLLTTSDSS